MRKWLGSLTAVILLPSGAALHAQEPDTANRLVMQDEPQPIIRQPSPHSAEIADPASGLSVRAASVTGAGVLMPGETFIGGQLTYRNSWRRSVEIGFAPTGLEDIGLAFKVAVTEDRKPWQFNVPLSHGVTSAGLWQQNQTSAFGVKLSLLDSRLRYAGGISSSRYGEARASAGLTPDNLLYRKPVERRAAMQWHRVDAKLWERSNGNATAWFSYADIGQGFRNMQQRPDMPLALDGRTMEFGANLSSGKTKFSLMHQDSDSIYGHSLVTRGALTFGPVRMSISQEGWNSGSEPDAAGWQSRRTQSKAAARFALRDIVRSSGLDAILPDALTVKLSRWRRQSGMPGSPALTGSHRLGLELERNRGNSATRIGIAKGVTYRTAQPGPTVSRIAETWFDFSHSVVGDHWDVIAYGSVNLRKSADRTDRLYSGGISLSLDGDNWPKFSIGIDADGYETRGDIAANDFASQGINFSASADFSYLINRDSQGRNRVLKIKAFTDWSRTASYGEGESRELIPTVMATFSTPF